MPYDRLTDPPASERQGRGGPSQVAAAPTMGASDDLDDMAAFELGVQLLRSAPSKEEEQTLPQQPLESPGDTMNAAQQELEINRFLQQQVPPPPQHLPLQEPAYTSTPSPTPMPQQQEATVLYRFLQTAQPAQQQQQADSDLRAGLSSASLRVLKETPPASQGLPSETMRGVVSEIEKIVGQKVPGYAGPSRTTPPGQTVNTHRKPMETEARHRLTPNSNPNPNPN